MKIDYEDGRTRSINVSLHLLGAFVPCGVITFNGAEATAAFTYAEDYNGPPLDPINLNYLRVGRKHFAVNPVTNRDMLHRVFVDYLPGPWGVSVLQSEFPEIKFLKAAERLHWFGSRTVGSLSFSVEHLEDEHPIQGIERLDAIRKRSVDFFMRTANHVSSDQWELNGLASHGGARPKCIFSDKHGGQWLAKFNIDTDAYNYAKVEHAVSVMARACGIDAVETRSIEFSPGVDVLFVRRFDRTGDKRPHKVSAFSMMREDIVRAQNEGDYKMMFALLEKICCNFDTAKIEMFKRMLFNIAVNNTDDHLKNFELLLDEDRGCYELSPAYDLTVDPYPNPRVTPVFGLNRPSLGNQTIDHILKYLDFDKRLAYGIRDEIASKVTGWRDYMASAGLDDRNLSKLQRAFDYGLRDTSASVDLLTANNRAQITRF